MSNEGDINLISCTGKVRSITVSIMKLKFLLVQNLLHKFICVCLIAHIFKVKDLKLTIQNCMHRQNVHMFESHIHNLKIKLNFALGYHN
jgi:hypothetical protein